MAGATEQPGRASGNHTIPHRTMLRRRAGMQGLSILATSRHSHTPIVIPHTNRHSHTPTVIPTPQPSFPHPNRHSGVSRNPEIPPVKRCSSTRQRQNPPVSGEWQRPAPSPAPISPRSKISDRSTLAKPVLMPYHSPVGEKTPPGFQRTRPTPSAPSRTGCNGDCRRSHYPA